jgi:hypothetical protein
VSDLESQIYGVLELKAEANETPVSETDLLRSANPEDE